LTAYGLGFIAKQKIGLKKLIMNNL